MMEGTVRISFRRITTNYTVLTSHIIQNDSQTVTQNYDMIRKTTIYILYINKLTCRHRNCLVLADIISHRFRSHINLKLMNHASSAYAYN